MELYGPNHLPRAYYTHLPRRIQCVFVVRYTVHPELRYNARTNEKWLFASSHNHFGCSLYSKYIHVNIWPTKQQLKGVFSRASHVTTVYAERTPPLHAIRRQFCYLVYYLQTRVELLRAPDINQK